MTKDITTESKVDATQSGKTRYPGSRPFTQADEALFFGRDQDILNMSTFINVEKVVVLYGKSGLGKSSLLNAGVLPNLTRQHAYVIVPLRFGSWMEGSLKHPIDILEDALAGLKTAETFLNSIEAEDISFWQHVKSLELTSGDRVTVFLVFDQFEELFTHPEGVDDFAKALADLLYGRIPESFRRALRLATKKNSDLLSAEQLAFLERPVKLKVLMSIRSDRMSLLDRLSAHIPSILQNCYELKPLSRSQAEAAILAPAGKEGDFRSPAFSYQRQAVEKMLNYLTQDGRKSIESFQLQILCQFVEENIVIRDKDTFVEEADLGDLKRVYEDYYDRTLLRIGTEEEQRLVRVFVEEGLIFEKEERRIGLYEGQIQSQFQIGPKLLKELADTHLIRSEPHGSGGYIYELSHDTLVAPILRAKGRRLAVENEKQARQLLLLQKQKRKKKAVRALLFLALLGLPVLFVILAAGAAQEVTFLSSVGILVGLPFLILLLILLFLAPLALAFEFVSGDSVMSRLRRRAADPKKKKGMLSRIGRWLS